MKQKLSPDHARLIRESAISPEVAQARGYRSVWKKSELGAVGFANSQKITPTLLIPIRDVHGEIATYQHRPDAPPSKDGKTLKAVARRLDDPPQRAARSWDRLGARAVP